MGRLASDGDHCILDYVIEIFKRQGRSFLKCEECGKELNGKFTLHHTKYEGATINDIEIVCNKCNTQSYNKGLA